MGFIKGVAGEYSWIKYIKNRILNNKNFLGITTGPTGSGKSLANISIAEMLDKNFSVNRIVFGLRELMDLINSKEKFPKGTVFLWDEFQIDAGNRDWQSLTNKMLNSLLSTFRHQNFILLITTPYADFIDSQASKLMHAEFIMQGINKVESKSIIKPMLIQYNSRKKKYYYKHLRVKGKNGLLCPIVKWEVPRPSKWLEEAYELKKTKFTQKLNKEIEDKLNELERKNETKNGLKPLTNKQEEVVELLKEYEGDVKKVASELNLTPRTTYFHIAQAKKKGYEVKTKEELAVNDG